MAATADQLKELARYVDAHPGWEIDATHARADKSVDITAASGYQLTLLALEDQQWRAESDDSGWTQDRASHSEGSLRRCLSWLRTREATLYAEYGKQVLEDIADGRKQWKVTQRGDQVWAGRTFDYGRHGQVLLSVQMNHDIRLAPLLAQVNLQFSAGPEASHTGTYQDVGEWLNHWEETLSLPLRLAECKTEDAAVQLVASTPDRLVVQLAYILEIDTALAGSTRRTLVAEFGPKTRAGR